MSQTVIHDLDTTYARIVEEYAHFFDRPEVRLRFLNKSLKEQMASCEKLSKSLSRFKFIEGTRFSRLLLDRWMYFFIIREVSRFSRSNAGAARLLSLRSKVPFGSWVLFHAYRLRYVLGPLCVLVVAAGAVWLGSLILSSFNRPGVALAGQNRPNVSRGADGAEVARFLPDYKPAKVWMVEQENGFERYSNGLRILRDYETTNHDRGYNVFGPGGEKLSQELHHEPVGIVYHTSESEIMPFLPENNDSIGSRSNGLLKYVQTKKAYNYVIDRFGQVYRIVRDDQAANHAGNSIWGDQKGLYVGLNESFLGVCFETRSETEEAGEQLTEAQILAGRLLTQALRSRHNIDDAYCTTHGLVSINPQQMLIAYHHDWVRNFPFEAMGLSDKYKVPTASVSVYGFTYEEDLAALAGGEMWAGARSGEEMFRGRSASAGADVTEMRRRMRDLYREQLSGQNAARRSLAVRDGSAALAAEADAFEEGPGRPSGE